MQKPYKIELFDRSLSFRSYAAIPAPTIYCDYLTLERTSITVPPIAVQKGDFAHITDMDGNVVYQGIVDDYEITKSLYRLQLAPLQSLFDIGVSYDRVDLQTGSLEDFIAGIITTHFISNPDTLQNITGLTVTATTSTTDTALNIKSNVHEFYDIISKALSMYGIVVEMEFLPQAKEINVTVGVPDESPVVFEADLENVLQKNFVLGDAYGQINKLVLINKYDESERLTYYLHTDGTISTVDTKRITPVFLRTEYVESDDFAADAAERASVRLKPQALTNLIELTYSRKDKLLHFSKLKIGIPAIIYHAGKEYKSILTGYELTDATITLSFGAERQELTKKLIIQARESTVDLPPGMLAPDSVVAGNLLKFADATGKKVLDSGLGAGVWTAGKNVVPILRSDGVIELGRVLDFHYNAGGGEDYDTRLQLTATNILQLVKAGDSARDIWHSGNLVYEYSTYTVNAWGSQVAGSPTYAWRNGWYVRIGRGVMFGGRVGFSNLGGMQGVILISLPFTAANFGAVSIGSMANWSGQGSMSPRGHYDQGNAFFAMMKADPNAAAHGISHADLQNNTYIYGFMGVMLVS